MSRLAKRLSALEGRRSEMAQFSNTELESMLAEYLVALGDQEGIASAAGARDWGKVIKLLEGMECEIS